MIINISLVNNVIQKTSDIHVHLRADEKSYVLRERYTSLKTKKYSHDFAK